MHRRWVRVSSYSLIMVAILGSALLVSGCDALDFLAALLRIESNAQAQQGKRIETFSTVPGSLLILTDTDPTIDVHDGTTVYTQLAGSLTFTLLGGSEQTLSLEAGDMVIERPVSGLVTVVRAQ